MSADTKMLERTQQQFVALGYNQFAHDHCSYDDKTSVFKAS
jgi:hypothetical protein